MLQVLPSCRWCPVQAVHELWKVRGVAGVAAAATVFLFYRRYSKIRQHRSVWGSTPGGRAHRRFLCCLSELRTRSFDRPSGYGLATASAYRCSATILHPLVACPLASPCPKRRGSCGCCSSRIPPPCLSLPHLHRQTLNLPGAEHSEYFDSVVDEPNTSAYVCVPVALGAHSFGVLRVSKMNSKAGAFVGEEVELLQTIAMLIAACCNAVNPKTVRARAGGWPRLGAGEGEEGRRTSSLRATPDDSIAFDGFETDRRGILPSSDWGFVSSEDRNSQFGNGPAFLDPPPPPQHTCTFFGKSVVGFPSIRTSRRGGECRRVAKVPIFPSVSL